MNTPIRMKLTAKEVSLLIPTKEVFRKTFFAKENKNLVLCRYLHTWYVIEHDFNDNAYYMHCRSKKLKDAISVYLEYLCMYA